MIIWSFLDLVCEINISKNVSINVRSLHAKTCSLFQCWVSQVRMLSSSVIAADFILPNASRAQIVSAAINDISTTLRTKNVTMMIL